MPSSGCLFIVLVQILVSGCLVNGQSDVKESVIPNPPANGQKNSNDIAFDSDYDDHFEDNYDPWTTVIIVAIVLGVLTLLIIFAIVVYCICARRRRRRHQNQIIACGPNVQYPSSVFTVQSGQPMQCIPVSCPSSSNPMATYATASYSTATNPSVKHPSQTSEFAPKEPPPYSELTPTNYCIWQTDDCKNF